MGETIGLRHHSGPDYRGQRLMITVGEDGADEGHRDVRVIGEALQQQQGGCLEVAGGGAGLQRERKRVKAQLPGCLQPVSRVGARQSDRLLGQGSYVHCFVLQEQRRCQNLDLQSQIGGQTQMERSIISALHAACRSSATVQAHPQKNFDVVTADDFVSI